MVVACFVLFAVVPAGRLWLLWTTVVMLCSAVFALKGVYYALLEEANIPMSLTGTAVGVVSVIGYTPDIINPLLSGLLLDAYPGAAGHQVYFAVLAALAIVGSLAVVLLRRFVVSSVGTS